MIEQNLQKTICLAISEGAEHVDLSDLSPQDWRKLIEIAQSHRLGPLLFWSVKNANQSTRNQIPGDVNEQLLLMYVQSTRRNLNLFRESARFLDLLDQQNIMTIVLKGTSLANTVYEDNGLRPMTDIDLLIPEENLCAAVDMAKSLGYYDPFPEAGPGLKKILSHHVYLIKEKQSSVQMELHHTLLGGDAFRYSVPVDWFFTQVEPFRFQYQDKNQKQLKDEYRNVFKLNPAAQLLFLTAHITLQHGLNASPLIWFYDLDRICRIEADRIDWNLLLEKA
ncbi:MAG: nucleotidyltransferase family protein, partial [Anaerolineales bacterium]